MSSLAHGAVFLGASGVAAGGASPGRQAASTSSVRARNARVRKGRISHQERRWSQHTWANRPSRRCTCPHPSYHYYHAGHGADSRHYRRSPHRDTCPLPQRPPAAYPVRLMPNPPHSPARKPLSAPVASLSESVGFASESVALLVAKCRGSVAAVSRPKPPTTSKKP